MDKPLRSQVRGIFRDGLTTLLRESIGNAAFFSTCEFSCHYMNEQLNSLPSTHSYWPRLLMDAGIGIISGGLRRIAIRGCLVRNRNQNGMRIRMAWNQNRNGQIL